MGLRSREQTSDGSTRVQLGFNLYELFLSARLALSAVSEQLGLQLALFSMLPAQGVVQQYVCSVLVARAWGRLRQSVLSLGAEKRGEIACGVVLPSGFGYLRESSVEASRR